MKLTQSAADSFLSCWYSCNYSGAERRCSFCKAIVFTSCSHYSHLCS